MDRSTQYTSSIYSFPSSSRFNMAPLNNDKDAQAQRALLGESAHMLDAPSSPLNTPSPYVDGLSPLSVASHLQDASDGPFQVRDVNPFLDSSWKSNEADHRPGRLVIGKPSSPKRQTRSVPVTPEPSAAALLPTIQEVTVASSSAPPSPPRIPARRQKQSTMNATYSLPPSALGITTAATTSSSTSSHMRRRPSPFPLGPLPPPPPQRRARYEPRPHIVDIATEQFNLKTRSPTTTATELQRERERQWKLWDEERARSLEMTREAAKNNRVQPVHRAAAVQAKSTPIRPTAPSPTQSQTKTTVKRKWWCFGGGATESDVEVDQEKEISCIDSHLLSLSSEEPESEEDDAEEWDEARTASVVTTGLLRFPSSCARRKEPRTRQRATLKKRAL